MNTNPSEEIYPTLPPPLYQEHVENNFKPIVIQPQPQIVVLNPIALSSYPVSTKW